MMKSFKSFVVAAILGLPLLVAGQAKAAIMTTIGGWQAAVNEHIGDKTFHFISASSNLLGTNVTFDTVAGNQDVYTVTIGGPLTAGTYTLDYTIAITPPTFSTDIVGVQIGSTPSGAGPSPLFATTIASKDVYNPSQTTYYGTLTSTNGVNSPVLLATMGPSLLIHEVISITDGILFAGQINSTTNTFYQAQVPGHTPPVVPEPASMAIWSLGAIGLAFGARRRKLV